MRKIGILGASLALLLSLVWVLGRQPQAAESALRSGAADRFDADAIALLPRAEQREQGRTSEPLQRSEAAEGDPASTTDRGERCVLQGVIVDQDSRPMANVLVQLAAPSAWDAEGLGTRLASFGPDEWAFGFGFEVRTGNDGRFRLEAPLPMKSDAWFFVRPDAYHACLERRFGAAIAESAPALRPGTLDLGTLELAERGTVFGRVFDQNGEPVEHVHIEVALWRGGGSRSGVLTGADGSFALRHVEPGVLGIKATRSGYLAEFRSDLTVAPFQDTGPVELLLRPAPSIAGRVTDAEGRPIEQARLRARSQDHGDMVYAVSAPDGTFELQLLEDVPHTLAARHGDFALWGDVYDKSRVFAPGTPDLEIRMRPASKVRFRVIDRETQEPLRRFGLTIDADSGTASPSPEGEVGFRPEILDRPGGELLVHARPGIDRYIVVADGYPVRFGDVRFDAARDGDEGEPGTQTLVMDRGATVRGRLLRGGVPESNATVEVASSQWGWRGMFRASGRTRQTCRAGVDGRFELRGLESEAYRLVVRPGEGAPYVRDLAPFTAAESRDLGDVHVHAGGAIAGAVLTPVGIAASGLTVVLDDPDEGITCVTGSGGRFQFDGVSTGEHTIWQQGRAGVIEVGGFQPIQVTEGETALVDLDATGLVVVPIELTVIADGAALGGVYVDLVAVDAPTVVVGDHEEDTHIPLGTTDARGAVRTSGRAMGPCHVRIDVPGVGFVRNSSRILRVDPGEPLSATVNMDLASLEVELSTQFALPVEGTLHIELRRSNDSFATTHAKASIASGALVQADRGFLRVDGERISMLGVGEGDWVATAYLQVSTEANAGAPTRREVLHDHAVSISCGANARIVLR